MSIFRIWEYKTASLSRSETDKQGGKLSQDFDNSWEDGQFGQINLDM